MAETGAPALAAAVAPPARSEWAVKSTALGSVGVRAMGDRHDLAHGVAVGLGHPDSDLHAVAGEIDVGDVERGRVSIG
jgi:hypothetical protein